MIIETSRLILKEHSIKNSSKLHSILSDPITMSFWPAPFSLQQTEEWINKNIKNYEELNIGRWAVYLKENDTLIGDCGIFITEIDEKREYDLGYIIDSNYWNFGYATEAAEACKKYAFEEVNINRLCANMPKTHTVSMRVAENIGMKKEKEFYNKRNRNILTNLYVMTKDQYLEK